MLLATFQPAAIRLIFLLPSSGPCGANCASASCFACSFAALLRKNDAWNKKKRNLYSYFSWNKNHWGRGSLPPLLPLWEHAWLSMWPWSLCHLPKRWLQMWTCSVISRLPFFSLFEFGLRNGNVCGPLAVFTSPRWLKPHEQKISTCLHRLFLLRRRRHRLRSVIMSRLIRLTLTTPRGKSLHICNKQIITSPQMFVWSFVRMCWCVYVCVFAMWHLMVFIFQNLCGCFLVMRVKNNIVLISNVTAYWSLIIFFSADRLVSI